MRPLLLVFGMGCTSIKMPGSGEEMQSRAHPIERVVRSGNSGPRVVVIHGYGATPDRIIGLMDGYAGEARLLAPQAPTPALKGWSWFPLSSEVGGADALGPGISTAADDLAAWLMTEGVSPSDPAVVTGFSQGGMLSYALAVRHPDLIALSVPIAGMLPLDLLPERPPPTTAPPIRAWHGDGDLRVPTALAQRTVDALSAAGWDARLETVPRTGHAVPRAAREGLHAAVAAAASGEPPTTPRTSPTDRGTDRPGTSAR